MFWRTICQELLICPLIVKSTILSIYQLIKLNFLLTQLLKYLTESLVIQIRAGKV